MTFCNVLGQSCAIFYGKFGFAICGLAHLRNLQIRKRVMSKRICGFAFYRFHIKCLLAHSVRVSGEGSYKKIHCLHIYTYNITLNDELYCILLQFSLV
jgi:hypothetical protein